MEDKYEKSKKKAKEFYSSIGSVICPGLNNELVSFSKYGFYHLLRKRGVLRPRKEQLRRFALLHSAVEVIKNAKAMILTIMRPKNSSLRIMDCPF